jgi:hypothetical protein
MKHHKKKRSLRKKKSSEEAGKNLKSKIDELIQKLVLKRLQNTVYKDLVLRENKERFADSANIQNRPSGNVDNLGEATEESPGWEDPE